MELMFLSIAKEFTTTPGPRERDEGKFSGEEFLEMYLEPKYLSAQEQKLHLLVDLDGTEGYATSFLEAAFGGLARKYLESDVLSTLEFKCDDEPLLKLEITTYIKDARKGL